MILEVLTWPHPILRQQSATVAEVTPELRSFIQDLTETMYARDGVGLAAIQTGRPVRIFVLEPSVCGGEKGGPPVVFINPEIVQTSGTQREIEGCLSFPGIFFPVARAASVEVRAQDLELKTFTVKASGLYARALQHEHDHTVGRTLHYHASSMWRDRIRKRFA